MRFVLVHGGFHAAWCWERVIDELTALGHEAVAVDLPGHGPLVDQESTLDNRRDAILAAMPDGTRSVLVGHSGGGFDMTLAADAAPDKVAHLIYLAAALPREGRSYPEAVAMRDEQDLPDGFDADVGQMAQHLHIDDTGAMTFAELDGARAHFYHDCDEDTVRWAFERLGPERFGDTSFSPVFVPRFWEADLPRSFIVCQQDKAMPRWLSDSVTRRLGVRPLSIDSSHSPFLSRPRELAELLVHATTTTPVGPLIPG